MKPETRRFLALVREGDEPSRADEERVLRALHATLAAGATLGAVTTSARSGFGKSWFAQAAVNLGSKLSLVAALTAVGVGEGDSPRVAVPAGPAAVAIRRANVPESPPRAALAPPPEPMLAPVPVHARPAARRSGDRRASTLKSELAVLRVAQTALKRGDGEAALRVLDAHRTADRTLLAERRAARILALCAAGRVDEARGAAADFARRHPDSVQREAIANSCAEPRRNRTP